jgi:hypothetical protein
MFRRAAVTKVFLLWLAGAFAIAIPLYRINMPRYRRLAHGERGNGVVRELEPGNHQTVRYEYEVGGRTYSGSGQAGFGNPEFTALFLGQRVIVYYDPGNPGESCIGLPAELIKNEVPPILLAGILFPAFALAVWSLRYPSFRRWLLA